MSQPTPLVDTPVVPDTTETRPDTDGEGTLVDQGTCVEERLLDALFSRVKTIGVQAELEASIDRTVQNIKTLSDHFLDVEVRLVKIDKENLDDPLAPKWHSFRVRFKEIVMDSERLADSIATSAHHFNEKILQPVMSIVSLDTVDRIDIQEILDKIVHLLEEGMNNEKKAHEQKEAFYHLKIDIDVFKSSFQGFGAARLSQIDNEMSTIDRSIDSLTHKLDELIGTVNRKVEIEQRARTVATMVGGFVSAFPFLPIVGPILQVTSHVAWRTCEYLTRKARRRESSQRASIAEVTEQKNELQLLKSKIPHIQEQVQRIAEETPRLLINLEYFDAAWTAIARSCQFIKEALERVRNRTKDRRRLLRSVSRDLLSAANVSADITRGLRRYSLGMASVESFVRIDLEAHNDQHGVIPSD